MSSEFIGTVNATRPKYEKGASDLTIRSRFLLSRLRQLGRITYNNSGEDCRWQVKYSQPSVETFGEGGEMNFANHDSLRKLSVDWRGYKATDSMGLKSQMMNMGDEALVKLFQAKQENLRQAINDNMCGELYKDGEATGRGDAIHGLETFMGSGTTVAADIIAKPSDTYGLGALSTALGNQGGTWSTSLTTKPNANVATDWPYGNGRSEYDFLSPKMVNWSSTSWGTGSSTAWEDNCWRAISALTTFLTMTNGPDGKPELLVLAGNLLDGYKNHHEVIRRLDIPHPVAADLGFKGTTMNQNGVAIEADFDVPVNTGYMLNPSKMELRSLYKELFWMKGPVEDPHSAFSTIWAFGFFGNATFSPKHFGKLFNYA